MFSGKSTKTAAIRAALFDSNMHQIVCRLWLCPRPTGEAYSAHPDPLAVFRGPTSKGREGRREGGRKEEGREKKVGEGSREKVRPLT